MLATLVSPAFVSPVIFRLWIGEQLAVVVVGAVEKVPADSFADAGAAIDRTVRAPAAIASVRRPGMRDWWNDTFISWVVVLSPRSRGPRESRTGTSPSAIGRRS